MNIEERRESVECCNWFVRALMILLSVIAKLEVSTLVVSKHVIILVSRTKPLNVQLITSLKVKLILFIYMTWESRDRLGVHMEQR